MAIDEDGLGFGPGAILAPLEPSLFGRSKILFDRERIAALVSVAFGKPIEDRTLAAIEKACDHWQAGDGALANISLAFCRLPQFGEIASLRLRLAKYCLDEGLTPRALDLGEVTGTLGKYDENQPRVPAGNGRPSGQWTNGDVSARGTLIARAVGPGLADALAPGAIEWLMAVASRLAGPAAVFGAMVIPSPSGRQQDDGEVSGRSDLRYHLDFQSGTLRIASPGDPDPTHALVAQLGQGGIYRDVATGLPVARALPDASVVIDLDRLPAAKDASDDEDEQPKLCPAPTDDKKGGRMLFDELYAQYVRDYVNPQRRPQLPPELTFALPGENGLVRFDDCREADGAMIEAKGNYGKKVGNKFWDDKLVKDWTAQVERQMKAAGNRRVEWYFHALAAAELFEKNVLGSRWSGQIHVYVLPYPSGVPRPNPRIR